jgi:hypothetical protein
MASRSQHAIRRADPVGRLDLCAIRLLEVAVETYGDLPIRGIYGTFKPEIDRSIKRTLGHVRIYVPPAQIQASAPIAKPKRSAKPVHDAVTMQPGPDGVYEVSDAR